MGPPYKRKLSPFTPENRVSRHRGLEPRNLEEQFAGPNNRIDRAHNDFARTWGRAARGAAAAGARRVADQALSAGSTGAQWLGGLAAAAAGGFASNMAARFMGGDSDAPMSAAQRVFDDPGMRGHIFQHHGRWSRRVSNAMRGRYRYGNRVRQRSVRGGINRWVDRARSAIRRNRRRTQQVRAFLNTHYRGRRYPARVPSPPRFRSRGDRLAYLARRK